MFEHGEYQAAAEALATLVDESALEPPLHGTTELRLLLARSYFHSAQLGRAERVTRAILADVPDDAYANLAARPHPAAPGPARRGQAAPRDGRAARRVRRLRAAPARRATAHPDDATTGTSSSSGCSPRRTPRAAHHVLELAAVAEVSGLDLVTVQDHPYQARHLDAWTLLSVIAARTSTLRVALNVANLPLRNPVVLAGSVASLDLLSGGRVELGIGAGAFWDAIVAAGGRAPRPGRGGRRARGGHRRHPRRCGRAEGSVRRRR